MSDPDEIEHIEQLQIQPDAGNVLQRSGTGSGDIDLSTYDLTSPLPLYPFISIQVTEKVYNEVLSRLQSTNTSISIEDLKDITSDAILKLHKYHQKGHIIRNPVALLYTIANRTLIRKQKNHLRNQERDNYLVHQATTTTHNTDSIWLLDALSTLTDKQSEAIRLLIFEQRSQQEVANILGITRSTVADRKAAALSKLRRVLRDAKEIIE